MKTFTSPPQEIQSVLNLGSLNFHLNPRSSFSSMLIEFVRYSSSLFIPTNYFLLSNSFWLSFPGRTKKRRSILKSTVGNDEVTDFSAYCSSNKKSEDKNINFERNLRSFLANGAMKPAPVVRKRLVLNGTANLRR